ncbi:uncharacterized protein [Branchiostoma lanceolatum]|uniref:uncharacterized protein isoform X1 n=1 Tax=Branchiostoma lanceolatum TaxID=7740 RepID=UPI00345205C1
MPGTLLRRPLPPKERQQPSVPMISPSPSPDIYRVHTPPHPLRLSPVPSLPSVVPSLASGMHLSQLEAPRDGLQSPVPTIDSKFMVAQKLEKQRSDTAGFIIKQNLLLPYKPRGPDFFPHREPKRPPPVSLTDLFREENFSDKKEPDFTLDDFHVDMSQVPTMPRRELQRAVLSKQNYNKMIKMLSEEFSPRQEEVRTTEVRGEDVGVPEFKHRIPQRQLMIEMAAIIGDSMKLLRATMESEDEEEEVETRVSSGPLLHQKTHSRGVFLTAPPTAAPPSTPSTAPKQLSRYPSTALPPPSASPFHDSATPSEPPGTAELMLYHPDTPSTALPTSAGSMDLPLSAPPTAEPTDYLTPFTNIQASMPHLTSPPTAALVAQRALYSRMPSTAPVRPPDTSKLVAVPSTAPGLLSSSNHERAERKDPARGLSLEGYPTLPPIASERASIPPTEMSMPMSTTFEEETVTTETVEEKIPPKISEEPSKRGTATGTANRGTPKTPGRLSRREKEVLEAVRQQLVSEYPEADALFNTVTNKYFMGSRRSGSPFEAQGEDDTISPTELAVLDTIVNGGHVLSIKAHFVNQLPDIAPITNTLVYLNLSFNDFHSFPSAVLLLKNLEILKMRNNPINEIPQGIYKLRKLRTFVLSYCMVTSLPLSFYTLTDLQYVDLSYNRISFLPNDVRRLQKLYDLNLEGNQLAAMPCGSLKLRRLKHLKVKNNFMHPLLWKENAEKMPQRLIDMCSVVLMKDDLYRSYRNLPVTAQSILDSTDGVCDCCHGPLYGPGIRLIRPCSKIFGIRKLPFLFVACSPHCHNIFMTSTASISKLLYEDD